MEITGNRSALIALFETAANEVHAGRPETIAEAIEAYQIFRDTLSHTKFTDAGILEALSNLKNEWTAFLSREPNADAGDITDAHNAVSEIHKAIEKSLRGMADCEISKNALDTLRRAATAVSSERNAFMHKLDNMERNDKNRFEWIKKRFEWLMKVLGFLVPWLSPDNMFDGIEEAGSEMKQEQLRAAILFCHDKVTGYPIARIDSKSKNRGKKTIADLARDVWAANPSWEDRKIFPDGYASEKSFENGLREQAKRNLKSFVWLKD